MANEVRIAARSATTASKSPPASTEMSPSGNHAPRDATAEFAEASSGFIPSAAATCAFSDDFADFSAADVSVSGTAVDPLASAFTFLANRKYSSVGSSAPNAWLMGPRSAVGFGAALAFFSLLFLTPLLGAQKKV